MMVVITAITHSYKVLMMKHGAKCLFNYVKCFFP